MVAYVRVVLLALCLAALAVNCGFVYAQPSGLILHVQVSQGTFSEQIYRDAVSHAIIISGAPANVTVAAWFSEPLGLEDARVVIGENVTLGFASRLDTTEGYMYQTLPCMLYLGQRSSRNYTVTLQVNAAGEWVSVDSMDFSVAVMENTFSGSINMMVWVASAFAFILIAVVVMMAFTSRSISEEQVLMLLALVVGVVVAAVLFNAYLS